MPQEPPNGSSASRTRVRRRLTRMDWEERHRRMGTTLMLPLRTVTRCISTPYTGLQRIQRVISTRGSIRTRRRRRQTSSTPLR